MGGADGDATQAAWLAGTAWWLGRPGWQLTRHPRAAQLKSAQALGDMSGSNVRSRRCKLRVRDALCCQPCGQSPRLLSVATGGRLSAIARPDGHSCQPSARRGLRATAALRRQVVSASLPSSWRTHASAKAGARSPSTGSA